MRFRKSMRNNGLVRGSVENGFQHGERRTGPGRFATRPRSKKVRRQLTAAHAVTCYRCFLPDLAGFTELRCAGPAPDLLHLTIPGHHRAQARALRAISVTRTEDAKIKGFHAFE